MAYKPFQEQALYQAIEDLAAWQVAKPTLGDVICS